MVGAVVDSIQSGTGLLVEHFTPEELAARDQFIRALSEGLATIAGAGD
jgi:hypothetical protein